MRNRVTELRANLAEASTRALSALDSLFRASHDFEHLDLAKARAENAAASFERAAAKLRAFAATCEEIIDDQR